MPEAHNGTLHGRDPAGRLRHGGTHDNHLDIAPAYVASEWRTSGNTQDQIIGIQPGIPDAMARTYRLGSLFGSDSPYQRTTNAKRPEPKAVLCSYAILPR
ncbi:hypothetical protein KM043_016596 [Ampulex compressa]|nr:hypothetical protein KM043_016596 [Ampulex compressa]